MIVMVLEAARKIAKAPQSIKGYRFKDLVFSKALIMSLDREGVETQVCLQPRKSNGSTLSESSNFQVNNYANDQWAKICHGTVSKEHDDSRNEVDNGKETKLAIGDHIKTWEQGMIERDV